MALFKIEKGLAANLTTNRPTTNEGYCYFTSDDGKFYIDIATGSDLTKRVCLNAYKADQWKNAININGMSVNGTANRFNYGTCGTATGTTAKTVSCTGYVLATGSEIAVKFTYANTATNPTLNVNSTGAKLIKYKGSNIPSGFIEAGGTYLFRYNGSNYDVVGNIVLVDSALSTSSTHAVQNKVVTEALNQKANKQDSIYYIVGDADGTAGVWTGTCNSITEYYEGLMISYQINTAAASTTTLNLKSNDEFLGAKPVYLNNNTQLTSSHYPVGAVLVLTYSDDSWKIANYDSNTNTKVTQASTTTSANYHLLLAYSTNIKTSTASTVRKNASLYYNPGTGVLVSPIFQGTLSGNASTATAFASAQTITLEGDVTGGVTSTGGWTINTSLTSTGVESGSYGLASKVSPAFGGTFNVPYFAVDSQGRITSAVTYSVTLPANPNTDSKVKNTSTSSVKFYITGTSSSTTNTGEQVFNPAISISGNTIIAPNFSGTLTGSATTAGTATVAASLATSTAGSATQPVYFSGGKPVACSYTLAKSVPADAVFTDTKYGIATSTTAGLVKSGTDITVDASGNVSVNNNSHSHTIANVTNLQTALDGKLSTSGGDMTGHIYLTGAKAASSTGNTSQLVFGTSTDEHVAISSNNNMVVINPTTTTTTNQILLKLDGVSVFPKGIQGNLTGTATRATADASGNVITTTYATKTELANLVDSAPEALNTLNELAAALGDDANFATTVTNAIGGKSKIGHTHTADYKPAGTINTPSFTGTSTPSGAPSSTVTVASSTHTHNVKASGSVSATFNGSSASTNATSSNETTSIYQITGTGSLPALTASVSNHCLTLTFSKGALPTRASVTIPTTLHTHGYTPAGTITATFSGSSVTTSSISGTTTVGASDHTHSVIAKGTIGALTFTGTSATITTKGSTN